MEGKLIMSTPTGAVDISDVPTVREVLEMQNAAKAAPPASAKQLDTISELAARVLNMFTGEGRSETPPEIHTHIDKGAVEVNVTTPPVSVNATGVGSAEATELGSMAEQIGEMTKTIGALPAPVVNVAPPVVNVAAPEVSVAAPDVSSFTDALEELKKALAQPKEPGPITRREVRRDKTGRITEVIDHRGD
jgi:hypothetical protein